MNATQVAAAKTPELVAFFNANCSIVGVKAVAKFADRKTAERRVTELVAKLPKPAKTEAASYVQGTCPKCGDSQNGITCGRVIEVGGHQKVINEHQAMCHVCGHEFDYETGKALRKRGTVNPGAAKQISESWKDSAVAAARVNRHSVSVDGKSFSSVRVAFIELGLPLGTHIKFRMALKAAGKLTDGAGRNWTAVEA